MQPIRYTRTARLLHWFTAAAIVAAFLLARGFAGLQLSPYKIHLINYHKWIGLTVLWLSLVRILWRAQHQPPQLPLTLSPWERSAASATHTTLYVLMVATPLLGWWLSSAMGFPLKYLGAIPLPDLGPKDKAVAQWIEPIHAAFAWTLVTLASIHAAAALRHQVIRRDDILRRII
jgi:cytochrome b561